MIADEKEPGSLFTLAKSTQQIKLYDLKWTRCFVQIKLRKEVAEVRSSEEHLRLEVWEMNSRTEMKKV